MTASSRSAVRISPHRPSWVVQSDRTEATARRRRVQWTRVETLFVIAALGLALGSAGFAVWKVGEMRSSHVGR